MITDALIYIFSFVLAFLAFILQAIFGTFTIWPSALLDGLTFFFQTLMGLNIFFFPVDTALTVLLWLIRFIVIFFGYKLVKKIFNYFRGADAL
jgi:hypothetical protein